MSLVKRALKGNVYNIIIIAGNNLIFVSYCSKRLLPENHRPLKHHQEQGAVFRWTSTAHSRANPKYVLGWMSMGKLEDFKESLSY